MSDVVRVANGLDLAVSKGVLSEEQASSIRDRVHRHPRSPRRDRGGARLGRSPPRRCVRPRPTARFRPPARVLRTIVVLGFALAGFAIGYLRVNKDFRARNVVEAIVRWALICRGVDRGSDHGRHRPVADLQYDPFLPHLSGGRLLLRPDLEPELRRRIATRHRAADLGDSLHLLHRAGGRGSDRLVRGDLSFGVCEPGGPGDRQAAAGSARRHSRPSSTACSRC